MGGRRATSTSSSSTAWCRINLNVCYVTRQGLSSGIKCHNSRAIQCMSETRVRGACVVYCIGARWTALTTPAYTCVFTL